MAVEDPYDRRLPADDYPRHKRPNGWWSADFFCMNCGAPMAEGEDGHGFEECVANPELVDALRQINMW